MKKGKTISMILIIILTILAILITSIMIFLIKEEYHDLNFTKKENKVITRKIYEPSTIEKIKIESTSSDIEVKTSEKNKMKLIIYGKDKKEVTSEIENKTLNINKTSKENFCFGWCFGKEDKIILYLPKEMKSKLEIENYTGDISLEEFENLELKITNKSGDIKLGKINNLDITSQSGDIDIQVTASVKIKNTSGEIAITNILKQANIETNRGDIDIMNFTINEDSNITSKSGDIFISSITDSYLSSHTSSGDIRIKESNRYAKYSLKMNTTSGDITVR